MSDVNNRIKVPGRLTAATTDKIIVGADEVLDDELMERQSHVNSRMKHYIKMAHIRIDAEEITREYNDNLLNQEINAKQLEIGAVETDIEPILESPNMLPSGAIAFNLGWYRGNENPEWVYIIADAANRILAGIRKDGSIEWSAGIPTPVKKYIEGQVAELFEYIDQKISENVLAIEFEENGDIVAYYGEDGNISDIYTDSLGDIIVEQEINSI